MDGALAPGKLTHKGDNMKNNKAFAGIAATALFLSIYFVVPPAFWAMQTADSPEINKHMAEAKAEAVQLTHDADEMVAFTSSKISWETHAKQIEMIKEHVNNTGKLLAMLQADEEGGSPWQQAAIKSIEPLLKELAANTGATINHLNENQAKVHMQPFRDYVKANYVLATELESLIRNFVDYAESKEKLEDLSKTLNVPR